MESFRLNHTKHLDQKVPKEEEEDNESKKKIMNDKPPSNLRVKRKESEKVSKRKIKK